MLTLRPKGSPHPPPWLDDIRQLCTLIYLPESLTILRGWGGVVGCAQTKLVWLKPTTNINNTRGQASQWDETDGPMDSDNLIIMNKVLGQKKKKKKCLANSLIHTHNTVKHEKKRWVMKRERERRLGRQKKIVSNLATINIDPAADYEFDWMLMTRTGWVSECGRPQIMSSSNQCWPGPSSHNELRNIYSGTLSLSIERTLVLLFPLPPTELCKYIVHPTPRDDLNEHWRINELDSKHEHRHIYWIEWW